MTTTAKDGKKLTGTTVLTFNVDSTKGANDGHFDLGPTIGAAGSKLSGLTPTATLHTHRR